MAIHRPDFGDGESRAIVPADPQPINLDAVPAGGVVDGLTMLASMQAQKESADVVPGNFLGPDIRRSWEREGGVDFNLKAAQDRAGRILGAADDAPGLRAAFDGLPNGIQNKIFDCLRLSPRHGPDAALGMLDLIESQLTADERATAEAWLSKRTPGQRQAILYGLGAR
jgi:hypothetical protein